MAQLSSDPPFYFSYGFRPTPSDYRSLPVSTTLTDNPWVTIPWYEHWDRPVDPAAPAPTVGGWTFLYGPCHFDVQAEVRLDYDTPQAQAHIQLYECDAAGTIISAKNAWEWEVGLHEGGSVHLDGAWNGYVSSNNRLRLRVDYWHATAPAKIIAANISGFYWRS